MVQLGRGDGRTAGFLVGPGLVATCVHAVDATQRLDAELLDGRRIEIIDVAAFDLKRGLAILRATCGGPSVTLCHGLAECGARAVAVGLPGPFGLAPTDTKIAHHCEVSSDFTVLQLSRSLDEPCWGGPVIDERARVLGVAAAARADGSTIGLAIPSTYLVHLLSDVGHHPLSVLQTQRRRQVPRHALSLLEGCCADGLERVAQSLVAAIQRGAPLYNAGDSVRCYRIYAAAARTLCDERVDCPGITVALREGLDCAATQCDADDQAWALRDAFDGVLDVIERWLKAKADAPPADREKKTYRN